MEDIKCLILTRGLPRLQLSQMIFADMHVNIVTLSSGGVIPMETHVMEHGIYILEEKLFIILIKTGRGRQETSVFRAFALRHAMLEDPPSDIYFIWM